MSTPTIRNTLDGVIDVCDLMITRRLAIAIVFGSHIKMRICGEVPVHSDPFCIQVSSMLSYLKSIQSLWDRLPPGMQRAVHTIFFLTHCVYVLLEIGLRSHQAAYSFTVIFALGDQKRTSKHACDLRVIYSFTLL